MSSGYSIVTQTNNDHKYPRSLLASKSEKAWESSKGLKQIMLKRLTADGQRLRSENHSPEGTGKKHHSHLVLIQIDALYVLQCQPDNSRPLIGALMGVTFGLRIALPITHHLRPQAAGLDSPFPPSSPQSSSPHPPRSSFQSEYVSPASTAPHTGH